MRIFLLFLLLYSTMGYMVGIFSYLKLKKENILSAEEIKKWKKVLLIVTVAVVILFFVFAGLEAVMWDWYIGEPIYHDVPIDFNPNIRRA